MYSSGYSVQTPESGRNPRKKRKNPDSNADEILCSVCDIWVAGVPQYQSHVDGIKHQRRSKERAADQVVERMPFMMLNKETGMYTCTACDVILNSSLVAMMHVSGSRHKENMDEYEAELEDVISYGNEKDDMSSSGSVSNGKPSAATSSSCPPSSIQEDIERKILEQVAKKLTPVNLRDAVVAPTVFECTVCDIRTNSETQLQQHLLSVKHKNRLSADPNAQPPPLPVDGFKQFHCDTCSVWVNSQIQLDQHMTSEKHKSNASANHTARYTPYPTKRPWTSI